MKVRRVWPIILIIICFLFLTVYIILNDLSYRNENSYLDIQITAYEVNSKWHQYIGTLRGLLLTTNGFSQTLEEARLLKMSTEALLDELAENASAMNPELQSLINAYTRSVHAGLDLGQELIDNGEQLMAQPDLPPIFKEGRVGFSSITGKDITELMGDLSAYQYYQLVRKLKSFNVLFDQIYSSKLDELLVAIADTSESFRRKFFIIRISILSITVIAVIFLVFQLYRLNLYLRRMAEKTKMELNTTQNNLTKVQKYLQNAQYQQSLFEMVAGISHELNTPLGNCISTSSYLDSIIAELQNCIESGDISKSFFEEKMNDSQNGFRIMQENLNQMKFQIETFKRLSSVNYDFESSFIDLETYLNDELPRLAVQVSPEIIIQTDSNALHSSHNKIRYGDLNQIFEQLIQNSYVHGNAKDIHIRFTKQKEMLKIEYWDLGKEINAEEISRFPEPFFTSLRGTRHMGLGLSILVSFISNKLRGEIEFLPGNPGLLIIIKLPLNFLA